MEAACPGLLGAVELLVDIRLNQRLANGFRTRLFARLARLPMATIDDHRIGDSVYRVMYDAPDLPGVCSAFTLRPLFTVIGVLIALYLMGTSYSGVAPEIIWVSLAVLPISFFVTVPLSGFVRRIQQSSRAAGTATTNAIEESMSNLHAVQSLGGMDRETKRVESRSRESFRRFRHVVLTNIGIGFIYQAISGLLAIFVTVYVANRIFTGVMSPGDFFVLIELALTIGGSGLALGMIWIGVQSEIAAVRRVFFFLDMEVEEPRAKGVALSPIREGVRFDGVSLRYANGHQALRDVSLDLNVGELVAVVGPTGAGKTSLAYLVPAYYRPTRGRVLIDGVDIEDVDTESLRSQISYVFQEHLLQNESIRSNLLLANPEATEDDLIRACETAGAMDFIADPSRWPGYGTRPIRRHLERGSATAPVHSPRPGPQYTNPDPGRTDRRPRSAGRKRLGPLATGSRRRPVGGGHRPPVIDDPPGGPHRVPGRRRTCATSGRTRR